MHRKVGNSGEVTTVLRLQGLKPGAIAPSLSAIYRDRTHLNLSGGGRLQIWRGWGRMRRGEGELLDP